MDIEAVLSGEGSSQLPLLEVIIIIMKIITVLLLISVSFIECVDIDLLATIYDHQSSHSDFQVGCSPGCNLELGLVDTVIGPDRKPSYSHGLTPSHTVKGGNSSFSSWFRNSPGVNMEISKTFTLSNNPNSPDQKVFSYTSSSFFPIDNEGFGNFNGYSHNYHFCMEMHTSFTFLGGEVFDFCGDDDVWVFIDDLLVIDLGGVHPRRCKNVDLDSLNLTPGETYLWDFFFCERQTTGSNLVMSTSIALQPQLPLCGNGVVETGEECDFAVPDSGCCSLNCTFLDSQFVCREAADICDIGEYCTGTDAFCPSDSFQSSSKQCSGDMGLCDAYYDASFCTGTSAYCPGNPFFNPVSLTVPRILDSIAYDVISFDSFVAQSGNIEGRVAVRNNYSVTDGFSIGYGICDPKENRAPVQCTPYPTRYSLLVGDDAYWKGGDVQPDDPLFIFPIFIGGEFRGPEYLAARIDNASCSVSGCTDLYFDETFSFYSTVSSWIGTLSPNVDTRYQWSGIFLRCNSVLDGVYVVDLDVGMVNQATWFQAEECNFQSIWIVRFVGSGELVFHGGSLGSMAERTIYSIPNTFSKVVVDNVLVAGNILAPFSDFEQTGGHIEGKVVAKNILDALSIDMPHCFGFHPVLLHSFLMLTSSHKVQESECPTPSDVITVQTHGQFLSGDTITISPGTAFAEDTVIVEKVLLEQRDGSEIFAFRVDPEPVNSHPDGAEIQLIISSPKDVQRPSETPTFICCACEHQEASTASTLIPFWS